MFTTFSFSKDTVGFLLEGEISKKEIQKLNIVIEEKLVIFDKINLYLEDANVKSFTLPAVLDQIAFKFNHRHNFSKIALVSDRKWVHWCAAMETTFVSGQVRSFESENRLEAIAWIAENLDI